MALVACAAVLPGTARALGVSNPLTHSSLGQPLNLLFPLRLNPDENLSRDCVRAEVMAGEARLPQGLVQFRLESDGAGHVRGVRLLSSVQVDEPIVTVNLSLGCPAQLTRQFTAFVDPPDARPTVAAPLAAEVTPVAEGAVPAPAPAMEVKPAATARLVAQAPASPPKPRPKPRPKPVVPAPAASAASAAMAEAPAPKPVAAAPVSRLRMDPLDVPAETAAAAAASAPVPPPVSVNDETLARLQQLEDKLDQVHKENVAAEDQFKLLRAQLEEAREQRYRNVLVYGLGVFLAALALICAYLWTSLRREREQRERDWRSEADRMQRERDASPAPAAPAVHAAAAPARPHAPPPSPLPPFSPPYQPANVPRSVAHDSRTLPAVARPALDSILQDEGDPQTTMASAFVDAQQSGPWPAPVAGSEREMQPTAPLPLMQEAIQLAPMEPKARHAANSVVLDDENHEVSVEELIDLEQQVDFFEVLGQDEAAIDLLKLRIATGQESALPYLKLMEIYQRRGDEAAFNSLHGDFARNFKAVPPSWGAKLNEGRGLESYPRVLDIVQQYWSDAGASMALLQNLLSHGGEDAQGFDLPAYRDLLMLYGLARDQSEREVRGEPIDLFLPLDAGAPSVGTSMMATQPIEPSAETIHLDLSLDIDLDDPAAARNPR
ncbi:hypothetical protein SNE35_22085 [Paucibacter sp. R3-3]|uniref:Tfp pilus assembly protein FimV n=1 Tax=Roseateles agri TaxID=3098619 RepID=A0ABU5DNA6_9BURK|nr:hypothetical protein [Paucibacter sp. R3-3]MDY0747211.1 hypothetical protein [Paucibacter sp. R3-3]